MKRRWSTVAPKKKLHLIKHRRLADDTTPPTFQDLPFELLVQIFQNNRDPEWRALSLVSKWTRMIWQRFPHGLSRKLAIDLHYFFTSQQVPPKKRFSVKNDNKNLMATVFKETEDALRCQKKQAFSRRKIREIKRRLTPKQRDQFAPIISRVREATFDEKYSEDYKKSVEHLTIEDVGRLRFVHKSYQNDYASSDDENDASIDLLPNLKAIHLTEVDLREFLEAANFLASHQLLSYVLPPCNSIGQQSYDTSISEESLHSSTSCSEESSDTEDYAIRRGLKILGGYHSNNEDFRRCGTCSYCLRQQDIDLESSDELSMSSEHHYFDSEGASSLEFSNEVSDEFSEVSDEFSY